MYDAVAEAVPLADTGHNCKKAIVVISDGNDNRSQTSVSELKHMIHNSEVLIYAIGIDGGEEQQQDPPGMFCGCWRIFIPFPGAPRQPGAWPGGGGQGTDALAGCAEGDEHVNESVLREITDDSGGCTDIYRDRSRSGSGDDGDRRRADEAVFPGYPAAAKKDGQWHTIRVEVKSGRYQVRARRGYVAS